MKYFTIRKRFLVPSFDLEVEEEKKIDRFLQFLEDSEVGRVINKYVLNSTKFGGRPNVNYYNLFAVILFGFAFGKDTLRDLEEACKYDLRYISIMEQVRPSYSTFARFIKNIITPNEKEIFSLLMNQLIKEIKLDNIDAFLDGSKFEANSNKYKFVWMPLTFHERISTTFFNILKDNNLCTNFDVEKYVSSKTVSLSLTELNNQKDKFSEKQFLDLMKTLSAILLKVMEYEEKENICGPNRKSYFKTDKDATAMCLKADYYSGLGTNLHAAYNTQIIVSKGFVLAYYVSQSRSDLSDFIPTLDYYYEIYNSYPTNLCADAGYGSLENYLYLEKHNIGNYVKHSSWEGNLDATYPDSYRLNEDKSSITCLNGLIGYPTIIPKRHPKHSNSIFFKIEGCSSCEFKPYCMRFIHNYENNDQKIFEVNIEFLTLKQKAEKNLLSPKGIELRVNRSIQVEGVFGNEKQNKKYTRIRRRGIENVSSEMMLVFLGSNLKKLFNYFELNTLPTFWVVPNELEAQTFKKPSFKKLSKKGKKINERTYKNKQAKLV